MTKPKYPKQPQLGIHALSMSIAAKHCHSISYPYLAKLTRKALDDAKTLAAFNISEGEAKELRKEYDAVMQENPTALDVARKMLERPETIIGKVDPEDKEALQVLRNLCQKYEDDLDFESAPWAVFGTLRRRVLKEAYREHLDFDLGKRAYKLAQAFRDHDLTH